MANEKRLIDANALVMDLRRAKGFTRFDDKMFAIDIVNGQDIVDAVEVVYAKWENVQNGKGCCSNCHRLDNIDNLATHCRYCGAVIQGDT